MQAPEIGIDVARAAASRASGRFELSNNRSTYRARKTDCCEKSSCRTTRAPSPDTREPGRGQKALETSTPIQAISETSQIAYAEPLCQTPSRPQGDVPAGFYASPGRSSSPNSLATATACEDGPEGEIDARPPTKRQRIAGRMQADSQPEPPATFQQIILQPVADGTFPGNAPPAPVLLVICSLHCANSGFAPMRRRIARRIKMPAASSSARASSSSALPRVPRPPPLPSHRP